MTDYGTIKLPRSEYERHNEERKKNKQTWAEYIDGQAPVRNNAEVDVEEIASEVSRQIDYAQLAGQVASELEGRMR